MQLAEIKNKFKPQSWDKNSQPTRLVGFYEAVMAFDSKLDTYWASNEPKISLPKDIGLEFPKPTTVKGARVVYLTWQQRPSRTGTHWQYFKDNKWHNIPYRPIDNVTVGTTVEYLFKNPVTVTKLRLYMDDMAKHKGATNGRPTIRDIQFLF
jgi:hypothetical protein